MKQMKKMSRAGGLTLALLFGLFSGCTKEGFGGDATLNGTVNHHGLPIPHATVFIKFGARELPGTTADDFDTGILADSAGFYAFEGLQKGDYYLYGIGYDSSISEPVTGGVYVKVGGGAVTLLDLPVTE